MVRRHAGFTTYVQHSELLLVFSCSLDRKTTVAFVSRAIRIFLCAQVNDPFGSHACLETSDTSCKDVDITRRKHVMTIGACKPRRIMVLPGLIDSPYAGKLFRV